VILLLRQPRLLLQSRQTRLLLWKDPTRKGESSVCFLLISLMIDNCTYTHGRKAPAGPAGKSLVVPPAIGSGPVHPGQAPSEEEGQGGAPARRRATDHCAEGARVGSDLVLDEIIDEKLINTDFFMDWQIWNCFLSGCRYESSDGKNLDME
jgi:hypothetical protein